MIYPPAILPFIAAGVFVSLAARSLPGARSKGGGLFFVLSGFSIAAISISTGVLMITKSPDTALDAIRAIIISSFCAAAFIIPYFLSAARSELSAREAALAYAALAWGLLLAGSAAFMPIDFFVAGVHFLQDGPGYFWGATLPGWGKAVCSLILLVNVFALHRMENIFRPASIPVKVTLKYPFLGLIAASLLNFTVFSRIIAESVLDRAHMSVLVLGTLILGLTYLYSASRYKPLDISAPPDRKTSTYAIFFAGIFIIALALISYLSSRVGLSYDRFTVYLLGLFVIFLIFAGAISGKARRYARRFISENFQPDKYNYRREWRHYSKIMSSSSTMEVLLGNMISSICETMLVARGCISMKMLGTGPANYGPEPSKTSYRFLSELATAPNIKDKVLFFNDSNAARLLKAGAGHDVREYEEDAAWIKAVSFLKSGDDTIGMIALGVKDTMGAYTEEDRNFLSTISEQLVTAVENLMLEQKIIESDRIESFNRFASFVIHDLKNTLGMLSLTAENAKHNMDDPEFQKDAIETMRRAVEKLKTLIGSLSSQGATPVVSKRKVDIGKLISDRSVSLAGLASSKGVKIKAELEDGIYASADPEAVGRIVENLVLNAVDASAPGGEIAIGVEREPEDSVSITVSDKGKGFDPAYLSRHLFKPFNSTKRDGLGIGLVICKSLAEAHGGGIIVESEPDRGATVTVTIPQHGDD